MKNSLVGYTLMAQALNRRRLLKGAGTVLEAGAALTVLPESASADDSEPCSIVGLWAGVVSAPGNPFPPFRVWDLWGPETWISNGQTDLTYTALQSSLLGTWKQVGRASYRAVARFWSYSSSAVPSGFVTVEAIFTLSADGKKYQGVGPLQFFDTNGNSLGPPVTTYDNGVRIA
ncbi:MAG: hypothetical protein JO150_14490 [Acidobacteriaceae bacterium]|nr:hypothetical protein [Acidobacteriaceae bacterium]